MCCTAVDHDGLNTGAQWKLKACWTGDHSSQAKLVEEMEESEAPYFLAGETRHEKVKG